MEISRRVEKFIQDHTRNCYNYNSYAQDPIPWLTPDDARSAVEIAREEMAEKVCMYLNEHRNGVIDDEYIINLNKAIKDE